VPRILSFKADDQMIDRIMQQQQKQGFIYLSQFLRSLVDKALQLLEQEQK
jgi:hypothetical protein